ncbi:MAG: SPFH domain-containing protein [Candidatus Micrarchaeota archaeon]
MVQKRALVFILVIAAALLLALGMVGVARVQLPVAIAALILLAILAWLFPAAEQILEFERGVVFRFGKFHRTLSPGLFFYLPSLETLTRVDMRDRPLDVPPAQIITRDNVGVTVDTMLLVKVVDAKKSVVEVKNFDKAIADVVISELRTIVGKMALEELLEKTEDVNILVRQRLAQFEQKWGVAVIRVELEKLILPPALLESMTRRKSADEFKARVRIEAEARKIALETVNEAASKLDPNTMSYLYLETLKKLGEGKSTKILLPTELSDLASALNSKLKFLG